jgi:outer membrane protein assembly factor BamB
MGFLKILRLAIILYLFFLWGCGSSGIRINKTDQQDLYPMFGKTPSREFYNPVTIKDSVRLLWEAEANGSFPQSSITYMGDNLFINDLSGRIFCYNITDGKIIGQLKHKNPVYTTPVLNRYTLFYVETLTGDDKSVLRLYNFYESRYLAEKEIRGRVMTEMLLLGQNLFFVTEKGLLYKFSHLGDQYWMQELNATVRSSPVSDGRLLYVATDKREILVLDPETGDIIRRYPVGSIISSGLTLSGNSILAGGRDGILYSVNKNNGLVNWTYNSGSSINAIPVVSEDRVYIVNLGGDIISINLENGNQHWLTPTDGVLNVTPLLTDNYLIIPDLSNRILFTDIKNGERKQIIELPNRAKLSPVLYRNMLFIGFDRGVIRAYEFI